MKGQREVQTERIDNTPMEKDEAKKQYFTREVTRIGGIVQRVRILIPTGSVGRVDEYRGGKLSKRSEFYDDGNPLKVEHYNRKGNLEGELREWYPNGNLKYKGFRKEGKPTGRSEFYFADGSLLKVELRKGTKAHGEWEGYYPDGTLKNVWNYKDGKPHGEWKEFYPDGRLKKLNNYVQGKPTGHQTLYSEAGEVIEEKIL